MTVLSDPTLRLFLRAFAPLRENSPFRRLGHHPRHSHKRESPGLLRGFSLID